MQKMTLAVSCTCSKLAMRLQGIFCHQFSTNKSLQLQNLSVYSVRQLVSNTPHRFSNSYSQLRRNIGPSGLLHQVNFHQYGLNKALPGSPYSTVGSLSSFWGNFSFKFKMRYSKHVLRQSALRLYLCCVELVDHDLFLREFEMPDTFNSWFRITELHLWLCMVRLAREGKEGEFIRNNMLHYMWQDIDKKTKKLSENVASSVARREGVQALSEQFKAILYGYDEALLSSDKVLAGALWRNFFGKDCKDVEHLEKMVEYVRRQLFDINKSESSVLLTSGLVLFSPLYRTPEAVDRSNQILSHIMKRL